MKKGISFKLRVLLGCLLVAILPLLLCSFVILNVFETTLSRVTLWEGARLAEQATAQLHNLFTACEEAGRRVSQNKTLADELLSHPAENRAPLLYQELYRAGTGSPASMRLFLYDSGGQCRYTTESSGNGAPLSLDWGVLRQARQSSGMVYCDVESYLEPENGTLLRTAQAVRTNGGALVGYLVIELTETSFQKVFEGMDSTRNDLYIGDRFLSPVYSTLSAGAQEQLEQLRREYMSTGKLVRVPGSDSLYHMAIEPLSGCHILLEQPTHITSAALQLMNRISLAATVACLLLCLLISYLLSRSLTRPVQQLNEAMERVKAGDLNVRVDTQRTDELGQLTQSFNRMTEELEEYLHSSMQRQQELNDAQIRMLQAQLNPHFLYNTLDTMKWLGKQGGIPEVASLAGSLAVILRRSISQERFVTLEQELSMTQRYIDIQRIRFSGRFEYILEVPEPLTHCTVPKLILQPLIENAILHGLADSDSGRVYIYATTQGGDLCLSVTDDGCGMDSAMVERLNSGGYSMQEGHLGLYNVNTILGMYYGEGYGLCASATLGVGTTVTARIPLHHEERSNTPCLKS